MIEPTLELQRAIRARLISTPAVLALVAATSIIDGPRRPETFPSIIIGEGQTVNAGLNYSRQHVRAYLDLHVWTNEAGLVSAKTIVGAAQTALSATPSTEGIDLVDFFIAGTRFLRDPSGDHGHAVISIEALIGWRT